MSYNESVIAYRDFCLMTYTPERKNPGHLAQMVQHSIMRIIKSERSNPNRYSSRNVSFQKEEVDFWTHTIH